jgi:hypothetical protein
MAKVGGRGSYTGGGSVQDLITERPDGMIDHERAESTISLGQGEEVGLWPDRCTWIVMAGLMGEIVPWPGYCGSPKSWGRGKGAKAVRPA